MCSICDDWKSNKIDSKQAMERIKDALQKNPKNIGHLTSLSDKILDRDVPMTERDEVAEGQWEGEYNDDWNEE
jgi:hypothetical protein